LLGWAGCAGTRYDRSTGELVDDHILRDRVADALDDQPVYKFPDVKVHTFRGVVQLSGFVATDDQKKAAAEIAQRVRGVTRVENNILLAPLERDAVREYIPGRDANTTNTSSRSQPEDASSDKNAGK
jgi:hyperosmotically inducible protein